MCHRLMLAAIALMGTAPVRAQAANATGQACELPSPLPTTTVRPALYVLPAHSRTDPNHREEMERTLAASFAMAYLPPAHISFDVPFAPARSATDSQFPVLVRAPRLSALLAASVARGGHLRDIRLLVGTESPELNASLLATASRVDSAGTAAPSTERNRESREPLLLRIQVSPPDGHTSYPLLRIRYDQPDVDEGPSPREVPPPHFPLDVAMRDLSGRVEVEFALTAEGTVDMSTLAILQGDYRQLTQAVLDIAPRWRYDPATLGGCAVPMLVRQAISFRTR